MATLKKKLNQTTGKVGSPSLQEALNSSDETEDEDEEEETEDTPDIQEPAAPEESMEAEEEFTGAPPSERKQAYEQFEKAKSRNEWLELAQLLGKAATQYGAAQAGMSTGRMMAGLDIPGVDYSKRTEGEERMLERRLRDIGKDEATKARMAAAIKAAEDRKTMMGFKEREVAAKEKRAAQVPIDPIAKMQAYEEIKERGKVAEEGRKAEAEKVKAGAVEQRKRDDALDAVITTQGQLISGNLTPEMKKQAERDLLTYSREAGLDIDKIYNASKAPGFWNKISLGFMPTENLDQKKVLETLQAEKAKRQQTAPASAQSPAAPPSSPAGTAPVAPRTLTESDLQEYSKKHNIDKEAARKFLTGQGYVISR